MPAALRRPQKNTFLKNMGIQLGHGLRTTLLLEGYPCMFLRNSIGEYWKYMPNIQEHTKINIQKENH